MHTQPIAALLLLVTLVSPALSLEPDLTVSPEGKADFASVQAAVASLPADNVERVIIQINDGIYHEKVLIDRDRVTLRGQSRAGVLIHFDQGNEAFSAKPDDIGRAVINIAGDDVVLENLTVANTFPQIGPHAFTVFGKGTRTVIVNCALLSNGADTVSLWDDETGMYYHADCFFMGSVDYVCPRGWCYITDSQFRQLGGSAGLWHAGGKDEDQKFVIRDSYIDGYPGFILARHHYDAQFYFIDCTISANMSDKPVFRVTYPDNPSRDQPNHWGYRVYFSNTHRVGGDPAWLHDNLSEAKGSPTPDDVTAKWTFAGKWDPESTSPPAVKSIERDGDRITVTFNEDVCVRGEVALVLTSGRASYVKGSGSDTLVFDAPSGGGEVQSLDGTIIAAIASSAVRSLDVLQ